MSIGEVWFEDQAIREDMEDEIATAVAFENGALKVYEPPKVKKKAKLSGRQHHPDQNQVLAGGDVQGFG
jgi:hypothetical protein